MEHRFNRASTYHARGLNQTGFTALEIIVGLAVVGLFVLICCRACVSTASKQAPRVICMHKAMAIACVVRNYASQWNGYTHPDPAYYVKELGYALKSEAGYDPRKARETKDFTCPLDEAPALNHHGYPCSYRVAPSFVGRDISKIDDAAKALIVAETGLRHELDTGKGATCVYADFHAELVTKLPPFVRE